MLIGDRIRAIRKSLPAKTTQADFGAQIGVNGAVITSYELNRVVPPEPTIKLICREFAVSYDWLKNGVEPMHMPKEEAAKDKIERIMDGDNEFVKAVFRELADLPAEQWEQIEAFVDRLASIKKDR